MPAQFIARQSRDSSTFNNTYQTLGSPTGVSVALVKIVNNSDQDIDVSIDGTTPHDFIPSNSFSLYDVRTNDPDPSSSFLFPKSTQFYVKGAAAGTGSVYLVGIGEG